jgi:hypothetical protein
MNAQFTTLLSLGISHAYYTGACRDVEYVIPSDTAQLFRDGRLLSRDIDGSLAVAFEGDIGGGARAPLPGRRLRFGLRLANPYFTNFTAVDPDFATATLVYRNSTTPTALDAAAKAAMVGPRFSHVIAGAARPVTVALANPGGTVVRTVTVTAGDATSSISYDLGGMAPGEYVVTESDGAGAVPTSYYFDPELLAARVFGVVELVVGPGFYQSAPGFLVPFAARQETLKYYVVVTNYPAADPSPWAVADAGAAADGRAQVGFQMVPSGSFTPDDISPSFLGDPPATVVLFQSTAAVARSEKARTRIQLLNSGEVMIPNLPQPGQEKTTAKMIIAVSKPNPSTAP